MIEIYLPVYKVNIMTADGLVAEGIQLYCTYGTISYPLFADADTGIYSHTASHYHAWPKAKRDIARLNVDKFPYLQKQTRCKDFIPFLRHFRSFKTSQIPFIWPKSS